MSVTVLDTEPRSSLSTAAARNLATTTKSVPQMQEITPRWLLRMLPWEEAEGGTYRVNRRLTYAVGDGRLTFTGTGAQIRVIPQELRELPPLREFDDEEVLSALADRCAQQEFGPGEVIVQAGHQVDRVYLLAHGKASKLGVAEYGDPAVLATLADGDHFGAPALLESHGQWDCTIKTITACTVLVLPREAFEEQVGRSAELRAHIDIVRSRPRRASNKKGEADIELASGHHGELELPSTFVDYELEPREYSLSVAQTVLRVHTRVTDLYNEPMDQLDQQLRLTVAAIRERQEQELLNNREFGLLHNVDLAQRVSTRTGPPTPDDMDEILCRRRKSKFYLAHPRAIAAFGRECNRRRLDPGTVVVEGTPVMAWRGVPILPCDKIPVSSANTTSILVMRTGLSAEGVIGLRETGLPDEYEPGLNVRFMGIDDRAIASYLVSAYHSAAVLVPDALGILEHVQLGR